MSFDRRQRERFDEMANYYDRARPGYPAPAITEMIRQAALPDSGEVLEIGCGTGQLTRSLAERGCRITAIELGRNLARRAAENLSSFPDVRIVRADFETWDAAGETFDLVCSAQAFHWIDPSIGYTKVRALLRPNGRLALLWNLLSEQDAPMRRALDRVYRERAPEIAARRDADSLSCRVERTLQAIKASGEFSPPSVFAYPWSTTYTADAYELLLRTFSDHAGLPPSTLEHLLRGVRETVAAFGGTIDRPQVSMLFVTRPS